MSAHKMGVKAARVANDDGTDFEQPTTQNSGFCASALGVGQRQPAQALHPHIGQRRQQRAELIALPSMAKWGDRLHGGRDRGG